MWYLFNFSIQFLVKIKNFFTYININICKEAVLMKNPKNVLIAIIIAIIVLVAVVVFAPKINNTLKDTDATGNNSIHSVYEIY